MSKIGATYQADHDAFAIARSEAMNAYAWIENAQLFLLAHLLGVKALKAEIIYYNVHSAGERQSILKDLMLAKYEDRFKKWFKSVCVVMSDLSLERNKVVHWLVTNEAVDNSVRPVLAPSDYLSRPADKFQLLNLQDVVEFTRRCLELDKELRRFLIKAKEKTLKDGDFVEKWVEPARSDLGQALEKELDMEEAPAPARAPGRRANARDKPSV